MNNLNKKLTILKKYLNLNLNKKLKFKLKPFVGERKYFPPISKEWKNSVYVFNKNNLKNLPIYGLNINELIKNYFNLYLNHKYLAEKYKSSKRRRLSFNKIYVSKAEVKHTSSKAILTVYIYNRQKVSLLKKIKYLKKSYYSKLFYKKSLNDNINYIPLKKEFKNEETYINAILEYKLKKIFEKKYINNIGYPETLKPYGIEIKNLSNNFLIKFYEDLIILQKYKLKLNINKYKFEEKFLYKLKNFVFKIYNKKVEFNIVNMKSIILNSDFITKLLAQKLKNKKANVLKIMNKILNKVVLPKTNNIIERSVTLKSINFNLLENKFRNSSLKRIFKKNSYSSFSSWINRYYYNVILNQNYFKIHKIIFNSIKYKNLSGVRLEAKGRLSRRNRADRALLKVRLKGGLKNIDSSYKKLSSLDYRGYLKSNLEYSIYASKRTIGAFAVKGWVSGK